MAQTQDEGFHEIQLSGKQLAFLVMAATVVSVVIFLFGVAVGREVRLTRASAETIAAGETEPAPTAGAEPAATAPGEDPTRAAEAPAPPPAESLSYAERLEKSSPPAEHLKPAPDKKPEKADKTDKTDKPPTPAAKARPPARSEAAAAPAPPTTSNSANPAPATAPPPAPAAAAAATSGDERGAGEPAGSGYAVQIAALNARSEADAIAKRLTSKGYPAYVVAPASGSPSVFRVRVGKFQTRHEAETVAAKLQKEEQFKPWVTR